jgi:hypothetical protein
MSYTGYKDDVKNLMWLLSGKVRQYFVEEGQLEG